MPIAGDRRAWDAVAIADDGWTGIEGISRLGVIDGVLRRVNQKQRDDPRISRVVLVVADTVRNRNALRFGAGSLRTEYPMDTRSVFGALAAGRSPALNGIVLLRVPRGIPRPDRRATTHPHSVHNGGKVVDGFALDRTGFVDNPVGRAQAGS